ncbi:hypothetical protein CW749_13370 [Vibrio sp. vnigr-6D03]|uniref:hypothetical protein n=1 Tax=Vibrio sp. vnigr-6D03 TaxID=2058088 RepID=UPI000C34412B|nr:hypothetical protein [Vibrio sp. vnigr-6D03]PKF78958.1 hypothetical protein CW749_13370 [Vibrio sp. vnigr-6D03]
MSKSSLNQTRSLAFWFNLSDQERLNDIVKETSLHINYWQFLDSHEKRSFCKKYLSFFSKNQNRKSDDYLDLGLMIPVDAALEEIYFYLPLTLKKKSVEDISKNFKTSDIAKGIFNENLQVTDITDKSGLLLKKPQTNGSYCWVQSLHTTSDGKISENALSVEPFANNDGTQITIPKSMLSTALDNADEHNKCYFRIRICVSKSEAKSFVHTIKPADKSITSSYESTKFIDFRLNESRLLPNEIEPQIRKSQGKFCLPASRVDFLLAAKMQADIVGGNKEFHKSRFLEPDLWKNYFSTAMENAQQHISNGMVVYHWKKETKNEIHFDDFIAFVKLRERLSGTKLVWRYLLFAFTIGLLGSLCGSLLYSGPPNLDEMKNNWSNVFDTGNSEDTANGSMKKLVAQQNEVRTTND